MINRNNEQQITPNNKKERRIVENEKSDDHSWKRSPLKY